MNVFDINSLKWSFLQRPKYALYHTRLHTKPSLDNVLKLNLAFIHAPKVVLGKNIFYACSVRHQALRIKSENNQAQTHFTQVWSMVADWVDISKIWKRMGVLKIPAQFPGKQIDAVVRFCWSMAVYVTTPLVVESCVCDNRTLFNVPALVRSLSFPEEASPHPASSASPLEFLGPGGNHTHSL